METTSEVQDFDMLMCVASKVPWYTSRQAEARFWVSDTVSLYKEYEGSPWYSLLLLYTVSMPEWRGGHAAEVGREGRRRVENVGAALHSFLALNRSQGKVRNWGPILRKQGSLRVS